MECRACAKLNLYLDITGILPDGYHELRSVMQSVSLWDTVEVRPAAEITLQVDKPYIPSDERNTAFKAAKAFFAATGIEGGADISVKKRIPVGAGMAGGSADAAAVLNLLNVIYGLPLDQEQLTAVAASVGADVPFCLEGGTMLCEGKGEKLTPLPRLKRCGIVVVKPRFSVSTKTAYAMFDEVGGDCPEADGILTALKKGSLQDICAAMGNDLEKCIAQKYPEIEVIKAELMAQGAMGAMMTGSGSAVFGIFENKADADRVTGRLRRPGWLVYSVEPV